MTLVDAFVNAVRHGRLGGSLCDEVIERFGPPAALLRAVARLRLGLYAEADGDVQWVREHTTDPEVRLWAGTLQFCLGDYRGALRELAHVGELEPRLRAGALRKVASRAARLGWLHSARRAVEQGMALEPERSAWRLEAVRLFASAAPDSAVAHCESALELEPRSAPLAMELAGLLARLGRYDRAQRQVKRALSLSDGGAVYALEAARILLDCGAVREARRTLQSASRADTDAVELALARLELIEQDVAAAERRARRILDRDPSAAGAHCILGAVRMRADEWQAAGEHLERALRSEPEHVEASVLRAELALARGGREAARRAAHRASMNADGPHLAARLVHLLASVSIDDPDPRIGHERLEEVRDAVLALCPDAGEALESGEHARIIPVLETALERLGANRTASPTAFSQGRLQRLKSAPGPRQAAREVLDRIRVLPASEVLARFAEVIEAHPRSSLPICHRGELYLWLGDTEAARADFEAAIAIREETRFAYIGLCGVELLEGRPEGALEQARRGIDAMHGTIGPAMYAYRGEALRRLGRHEEAARDIEQALEHSPRRLGAWVNLALIEAERGEGDGEAYGRVADLAPGLVADAAFALGVRPADARAGTARTRLLERMLAMMRGNRSSSCYTYFTAEGELESIPGHPSREVPHRRDSSDLDAAERALVRVLKRVERTSPVTAAQTSEPGPTAAPSPVLSDEQLQAFVADGYIRLQACFSTDMAEEWVERANRRIAREPERWVRGYDERDPDDSLRGFDAADARTWTWPRIDLDGEHQVELATAAPRAWAAICQLMGGVDRVVTRAWSDYFSINLRDGSNEPWHPPAPDQSSWHFDDPSRCERLQGVRRGLIMLAYFNDVRARSGATFVAPESVALASRWMAEHPEGVDLQERSSGPYVTTKCRRFVELTGNVGDVYLLHPLMVHSSSANPSGRPRYMSTVILYLNEPLDPHRDDPAELSPVERAIRRGLEPSSQPWRTTAS